MSARPSPRPLLRLLAIALLAVVACALWTARADAAAVQDLDGCRQSSFAGNDDQSVPSVPLGFTIDFHGLEWSSTSVNNNGNITFDNPANDYTPYDFTTSGRVIIAPFLADVDTRSAGSGLVTYGGGTLPTGARYFCVLWPSVGYFAQHDDLTNSFQLLLTQTTAQAPAGDFDITFNYDHIGWETGDASQGSGGLGGTSAAAGYSSGDGAPEHFRTLPGSFTPGSFLDGGPNALIRGSEASTVPGRYVYPVVNRPESGGRLSGTVTSPDGGVVDGAVVDICATDGSGCATRQTGSDGVYRTAGLRPGTYLVVAHTDAEHTYDDGRVSGVRIDDGGRTTADVVLGAEAVGAPDDVDFDGFGETPGGVPVADWSEPGTFSRELCAGAQPSFQLLQDGQVLAGGQMVIVPGGDPLISSQRYQGAYPALRPATGRAQVRVRATCPTGAIIDSTFDVYIDPSGKVVDTNGAPIAGATVTLSRSSEAAGPFIQVPNGSANMSPANRVNADASRVDGAFGWDVVAGYYVVTAAKEGCTAVDGGPAAATPVLEVPPPRLDLRIVLDCGEEPPAPPSTTETTTTTAPPSTETTTTTVPAGTTPVTSTTVPATSPVPTTTPAEGSAASLAPVATAPATPVPPVVPAKAPLLTPTPASTVAADVAAALRGQKGSLARALRRGLAARRARRVVLPVTAGAPAVTRLTVSRTTPRGKPVRVAAGSIRSTTGRTTGLRLEVTRAGRALLRSAARRRSVVRLAVRLEVTPTGGGRQATAFRIAVRPKR